MFHIQRNALARRGSSLSLLPIVRQSRRRKASRLMDKRCNGTRRSVPCRAFLCPSYFWAKTSVQFYTTAFTSYTVPIREVAHTSQCRYRNTGDTSANPGNPCRDCRDCRYCRHHSDLVVDL